MISKLYTIISNKLWDLSPYFGDLYNRWVLASQQKSFRAFFCWPILEEQFPVPRNTAASKIRNRVILLLWQLWCHCNLDHNNFSSLSDTTAVAIFPNLCLWRRSLCSNLEDIDPEKLYRATLSLLLADTRNCTWLIITNAKKLLARFHLSW